jgi:hypothetical protein
LETFKVDSSDIKAVVDTNVLFDFFSACDLMDDYEQLGVEGVLSRRAIWRRARARESVLLAMHFHREKAATYSLHHEGVALLTSRVNPAATDTFETHFTTFVVHFVKEYLLRHWRASFVPDNDLGVKGNGADRLLLDFAKENKIPLITNEGSTPDGIRGQKLRDRASEEGVAVFTPGEYIAGKLDEEIAARSFLEAFRRLAPRYIARHPKPQVAKKSLLLLLGFYEHVLLGITEGRTSRVPVRLARRNPHR